MVGCHLLGCRLAVAQRGSTSRTQSGSRLTQSRCFESTIHTGSNISVTIWRPKRQRRAPLCSTQRDHLEICRSTCARLSRDMHLGDTVSSWGCTVVGLHLVAVAIRNNAWAPQSSQQLEEEHLRTEEHANKNTSNQMAGSNVQEGQLG